jgi:hypothetical protein
MLTKEEFEARTVELLTEESSEPAAWWWLSFADPKRPKGKQFLGACLVQARGFLGAVMVAKRAGINPGGEVQGMGPIPADADIKPGWTGRLLSREECEEFDRVHGSCSTSLRQ